MSLDLLNFDVSAYRTQSLFVKVSFLFATGFISLLFSTAVSAQDAVTGNLQGIVYDAANKPIVGATIKIISQETGVKHKVKTDEKGYFYKGMLSPGEYQIKVNAKGYIDQQARKLTISATRTTDLLPPVILEKKTKK